MGEFFGCEMVGVRIGKLLCVWFFVEVFSWLDDVCLEFLFCLFGCGFECG